MKVDPVFAETVALLFGGSVDAREAWDVVSKMDDVSEVHVPGNLKVTGKKKPKKMAAQPSGGVVTKNPINSQQVVTSNPINAQATVTKAFEAKIAEVVAARRAGQITTDEALVRIDAIEKAFAPKVARAAKKATAAFKQDRALATYGHNIDVSNKTKQIRAGAVALGVGSLGTGYALGRQSTVTKADTPDVVWTGEIAKMDTDKRQVFGWCSISELNGEPVVDLQGDYVPIEEIEKSAYTYVLTSRKGGDMHSRDGEQPLHTSDMIESFVVTPEKLEKMGLPKDALPLGWWVGFKVNDDKQWELVKNQERTEFSIHGKGTRKALG